MRRMVCLALVFSLTAGIMVGQAPTKNPGKKPPEKTASSSQFTVDTVIRLHKSGISEDILITKIKQNNKPFDLSADEILKLQEAKVSDRVIQMLMDPTLDPKTAEGKTAPAPSARPIALPGVSVGKPTGATPDGATPAGDPNDPATTHDSGIYLYQEGQRAPKMTLLEPAAYTGAKTGGVFVSAVTYGLKKAKQKAVLQGARANIRAADKNPVFYFYFEDKAAALGKSGFHGAGTISSPNQFVCIKLEEKKSARETIVMEMGSLGTSSGTHEKSIVGFKSEKLRPGIYKVIFNKSLEPGEYAFIVGMTIGGASAAGAALPLQIFDFGVSSRE
ncbi:MAG: hypothetical protein HYR55_04975 [Acidobacteria bacterium]|nr:hypothetical protein [Acidobacteriota bacterium]